MFIGGLTQNGGRALGDGPGDHGRAGANYLTCMHPKKTNGRDLQAGVSVDQIAAQRLQGKTRWLRWNWVAKKAYRAAVATTAIAALIATAFRGGRRRRRIRRRFGRGRCLNDCSERERIDGARRVSDSIRGVSGRGDGRCERLSSTLGGADKRKLDEYLYSIRDVEKRIQKRRRRIRAVRSRIWRRRTRACRPILASMRES